MAQRVKIVLTKNQWERISEILGNFGLLIVASIVVPALFDKTDLRSVVLGLMIATGFIYTSISTARKY